VPKRIKIEKGLTKLWQK